MKKFTKDIFVKKAKEIHGDKYDYSKVEYINNSTPVTIVCPIHGEFKKTPNHHLDGQGCPICAKIERAKKKMLTTKRFIEMAKKVHNDKYDYSKTEYKGRRKQVTIICTEHGEFKQIADNHLRGEGCPICGRNKTIQSKTMSFQEFVRKAKGKYGDRYSYDDEEHYLNTRKKIKIHCNVCGNDFQERPNDHLSGYGCPYCNASHLEVEMRHILNENKIEFEEQKKFDWLGRMSLDFFLPNSNIAIECQGEQHYKPVKWFGGKDKFDAQIERDRKKEELCKENGIKILYYSNKKWDGKTITSKEDLLKEI